MFRTVVVLPDPACEGRRGRLPRDGRRCSGGARHALSGPDGRGVKSTP